jgi:AcrR family transcriptional regulator
MPWWDMQPVIMAKKVHKLVRGAPVVQKVLQTTIQQLVAVGYSALRVDEVAELAQVNKTSIYRRWPTKSDLVLAAIRGFLPKFSPPNAGSLRDDMLAFLQLFLQANESPSAQGLMRVMLTEQPTPELARISDSLDGDFRAGARTIVQAAIKRGELAPGTDPQLLMHTLIGAVHHTLFIERKQVKTARAEQIVDLILYGALLPAARSGPAR